MKFAAYITGIRTIVETDHSALVQMYNGSKECGSARVNKWAMLLKSMFDLEVRYRPGRINHNADALSRAFHQEDGQLTTTSAAAVEITSWLLKDKATKLQTVPEGVSKDKWVSGQIEGEFGEIYRFLDKRALPAETEKVQEVVSKLSRFTIVDRCLYYINPDTCNLQLVVPEEYQHLIFHERHSGLLGVHSCGRKIYAALSKTFYWPNMRSDCERWHRTCPICAFTREPRLNTPPLQPIVAEAPFDLFCMDILKLGMTPRRC